MSRRWLLYAWLKVLEVEEELSKVLAQVKLTLQGTQGLVSVLRDT